MFRSSFVLLFTALAALGGGQGSAASADASSAASSDASREAARGATDLSCADCHAFAVGRSHPIGVDAPDGVALPLRDGLVDCTTCHDRARAHDFGATKAGLRLPAAELCAACHDRRDAPHLRNPHATSTMRVHGDADSAPSASGLDAESNACLGCHDGSAAVAGEHRVRRDELGRTSHPVGVAYDPWSQSGRKSRLRPAAELPADLRLPQGTVGCGTCHSPFSTRPGLLTVDNTKSRLCLSCHAM